MRISYLRVNGFRGSKHFLYWGYIQCHFLVSVKQTCLLFHVLVRLTVHPQSLSRWSWVIENVVIWITVQHDVSMCIKVYILVSPLTKYLSFPSSPECKSWTDFLIMPVTYLHFIGIVCYCAVFTFAVLMLLYCSVEYYILRK